MVLRKPAPPKMLEEFLNSFVFRRHSALPAMPVDVVRQDRFKAHIPAHAVEGRFDVFWRYFPPEQILAYLIRPPALLREPVESQIIRILDVVEKFHFLEVIEDGSNIFFATETCQLYRELLAAVGAEIQELFRPGEEFLMEVGLHQLINQSRLDSSLAMDSMAESLVV